VVGRPSKYTPELVAEAKRYLDQYAEEGDMIPSVAGLAVLLGVRRETCHVWAKEEGKEEFSNILGEILAKQERVLINKGLSGEFNSNITKLVLGKHGYHDKTDNTHGGAVGIYDLSGKSDEELDAIINSSK